MQIKLKILNHISSIFLLVVSPLSLALPSDNLEKLYISSDAAQIDRTTGVGVYTGNVKIDRGSTHVIANQLTTYSDKQNKVVKAIAVGDNKQPAQYRTTPTADKPELVATANNITYFPQKHYVILTGNAIVTQGNDSITGPHLEYDLNKQILTTMPDKQTTKGRTTIVIQPNDFHTAN